MAAIRDLEHVERPEVPKFSTSADYLERSSILALPKRNGTHRKRRPRAEPKNKLK
jgi:hypothetical protein